MSDGSYLPDISAESLASQLSVSLPIYVSPDDVNKQPQLCHLFEDLSHRITPTGVHKTTNTQLTQATHAMLHARQKYVEKATLHRLTTDILIGSSCSDIIDKKTRKTMLDALTLSEVCDHLTLVNNNTSNGSNQTKSHDVPLIINKLNVFNITEDNVVNTLKAKTNDDHLKKLAMAMEIQLEKDWTKIASFINPIGFVSYDTDEVEKMVKQFEDTKHKTRDEKNKLIHTTIQTDCLSQQVYGQLVEYSKILQSLMSKQRLSQFTANNLAVSLVKFNAHFLKLRCLQLEVLLDTYKGQCMPALKALEAHLIQRSKEAHERLAHLNHTLQSYSGIDPKFQHLLEEYAKLKDDISFAKHTTQEYVN